MAEEQQGAAQNKLGQLYVELGAKGLGNLTKGLNGLSAQFLLTKNAAQQFTKPLIDMVNQAGNSAVSLGKLQSTLGMTYKQSQNLKAFFDKFSLGDLTSDISALQTKFYDYWHNKAPLDSDIIYAFQQMKLSVLDYNGDLESTLKLIDDVQKATKNLSQLDRAARLRDLGLRQEWAYAFDKPDFNLPSALTLTDKETDKLIKSDELSKQAKITKAKLWKRFSANVLTLWSDSYNRGIISLADDKISEKDRKAAQIGIGGATAIGAVPGAILGGAKGAALLSFIPILGPLIGGLGGGLLGAVIGGGLTGSIGTTGIGAALNLKEYKKSAKENIKQNPKINQEWSLFPQKVPILEGTKEPLPPVPQGLSFDKAMQNTTRNYIDNRSYTINNTNNISGENAQELEYTILHFDEAQLQRNQFEKENMTGI